MTIIVDMNLSVDWVATLQESGIDSTHWSSIGIGAAPDTEIMSFARANDCTILTRDLDFGITLFETRRVGPSVIQIRVAQADPLLIGARVVDVINEMATPLAQGALITIDFKRTRLRLLPIR